MGLIRPPCNSDCSFSLVFCDKQPGDEIQIRVIKADWVVIYAIQLERPLPAKGALPFKIILSKTSEREYWALIFYRLKGSDAVEREYQLQLASLQDRHLALETELNSLQQDRDKALRQVDELARQLAAESFEVGRKDRLYRQALRRHVDLHPFCKNAGSPKI